MKLKNKKILLGVCGSIAAYKAAFLIRLLVKQGAEVRVVMTPDALSFISPLTLSTLSKNEVLIDYYDAKTGVWNNHVDYALWADVILIAPVTANTLAKMAAGICDNLLMAIWLSAKTKVLVAPAMDLDMYLHPTFKRNIAYLESIHVQIIDAEVGELASGLEGQGRLAEPEQIVAVIENLFVKQDFIGKKVLVNAGPTYEHLDPVRFIGNHSSGKMGIAIAKELANRGAEVNLILGPTKMQVNHQNIHVVSIESADDMFDACMSVFEKMDIAILSAAVSDYKPKVKSDIKIKKSEDHLSLELVKTPDTLASLGSVKKNNQILIGFALETNNEVENAIKKLTAKNLDAIVLNSLQDAEAGFGKDTNKITIIGSSEDIVAYEAKSKTAVAADIADYIIKKWK